jgi:hypothetical protein
LGSIVEEETEGEEEEMEGVEEEEVMDSVSAAIAGKGVVSLVFAGR